MNVAVEVDALHLYIRDPFFSEMFGEKNVLYYYNFRSTIHMLCVTHLGLPIYIQTHRKSLSTCIIKTQGNNQVWFSHT